MTLKSKLLSLARAVADEADRNAPFRNVLNEILEPKKQIYSKPVTKKVTRNRRPPAKIDPVQATRDGQNLREILNGYDIEELKNIVAEFGMDPSKLVMKWKDSSRIAEHIVEASALRASKGEAFR